MIDKGADINASNANGETPLHYACLSRNVSIVRVLLQNKVNINSKTEKGNIKILNKTIKYFNNFKF